MKAAQSGYTMLEMLIVLMLVAIALMLTAPGYARMSSQRQVEVERDALIQLSRRAQAEAQRRGEPVLLEVDPDANLMEVRTVSGALIEDRYPATESDVTMATEPGTTLTVCYSSRGFALSSCSSSTLPDTVVFSRGGERSVASIGAIGYVESR